MKKATKHISIITAALLVFAMAVISVSCTSKPAAENTPAPETEPTPEATAEATAEATPASELGNALVAYRGVIEKAAEYDYGKGEGEQTLGYKYALVNMQSGDTVPTLLLAQTTDFGVDYVRVFRFDPETGKVLELVLPGEEVLRQGAAGRGGFRGEISVLDDGSGLCASEFYSTTGEGSMSRIAFDGDKLAMEEIWSGNASEEAPFAVSPIGSWNDVSDGSGLEG